MPRALANLAVTRSAGTGHAPAPRRSAYSWPSGYWAASRCAACVATVVLPTPGSPEMTHTGDVVTDRPGESQIWESTSPRPTKSGTSGGSCRGIPAAPAAGGRASA
jgi:hypothetical protein